MNQSKIIRLIVFCLCLLIVRMVYSQQFTFVFLLWNLFLAWLPYYFIRRFERVEKKHRKFGWLMLSILFLPNAPYIITDLFHLKKSLIVPLWLDMILILSFAMVGLYFFINTVNEIIKTMSHYSFKRPYSDFLFKPLLMLLSGYGIYLGRYLRFNSWNLVTEPLELFYDIVRSLFSPNHCKETLGITLTFSIFLYLIYEIYENKQPQPTTAKSIERTDTGF